MDVNHTEKRAGHRFGDILDLAKDPEFDPESLPMIASHATFDCPGCKETEVYPLTQEGAREVALKHAACMNRLAKRPKKGTRSGVKQRLFAGLNLFPKKKRAA